MPKGYSLHIGLNTVNPDHYDGWDGRLVACESDAIQMSEIAKKMNFASIDVKLTKEATRDQFKDIVRSYSKKLQPGDLFLLTYSGHGGQLPDLNNDEADAIDETWCMYDGQIADDEIYRSEEHTSELQSRENLVCRLLLEKKQHPHIQDI